MKKKVDQVSLLSPSKVERAKSQSQRRELANADIERLKA